MLMARHPLGPWTHTGVDLNPWNEATRCGWPVPSQNNYVARVAGSVGGEPTYLFMADLWTTAPDGLKSHDLQFWAPLSFDDAAYPPVPNQLAMLEGFLLDVATAAPGAAAPVVTAGPFRRGSALPKILENQRSCTHSGTFEAWLLSEIIAGSVALPRAAGAVARCCCCRDEMRNRRLLI